MRSKLRIVIGSAAVTGVAAIVIAVGLALPAMAAPGAQGGNLPTPTLFPVTDVAYTLEQVGGQDETLTFTYADQDGFRFGETTVRSLYPDGMIFTVTPESDGGEIENVVLLIQFQHGKGTRFDAEWDRDQAQWVAHPWPAGGQPPWTSIDFRWRIGDQAGNHVETETYHVDYWDRDNTWFRLESDYVILYWRGFGEDDPDALAKRQAEVMASVHERQVAGFGEPLSYKPIAVVFPERAELAKMYGSGVANPTANGFTSFELGMSVQLLRENTIPENQIDCIWQPPNEVRTMEWRTEEIHATTGHEVTHLYQYEKLGGGLGFTWSYEGMADWFTSSAYYYDFDTRLRHLATLQDIPSLTTNIGYRLNEADGCYILAYSVGWSFYNYLNTFYGGIDAIHEIITYLARNESIFTAVEAVTGKPFLDVENEWRTYLGFEPFSPEDLDPTAALQPYEDNVIAVGDSVVLPAVPAFANLYEAPGPKQLVSGTCFANMPVTILRMGTIDDLPYFEVDCMGQVGWMTRDQLVGTQ
jgi:hypothetical protein